MVRMKTGQLSWPQNEAVHPTTKIQERESKQHSQVFLTSFFDVDGEGNSINRIFRKLLNNDNDESLDNKQIIWYTKHPLHVNLVTATVANKTSSKI